QLESIWQNRRVRFAKQLSLTDLAAVFEKTIFVGHDSGISHLAAAAGANSILLFGPTDPTVWAPLNDNAHAIRAPVGDLERRDVDIVLSEVELDRVRFLARRKRHATERIQERFALERDALLGFTRNDLFVIRIIPFDQLRDQQRLV